MAERKRWKIQGLLLLISLLLVGMFWHCTQQNVQESGLIDIMSYRTKFNVYRIELNTADVETLMILPEISRTLAQRIVSYREEHGNYTSVRQLLLVEGIDETLLDDLIPYVTIVRSMS